ncbi:MAG: Plug domain-containing protein [Ignavibacteriales bacterium]|nr:Plug domain-containing protein [Ignavibacteriales bacterium]
MTVTGWRRPEDIFAKVITEKDIEQSTARSLSDILHLYAPLAMNANYWGFLMRGQGNISLFWNGMSIDPYDVDFIDPYSVEKILIWRGMEAPLSYNGFLKRVSSNGDGIGGANSLLYQRKNLRDVWVRPLAGGSFGSTGYVIDIRTK